LPDETCVRDRAGQTRASAASRAQELKYRESERLPRKSPGRPAETGAARRCLSGRSSGSKASRAFRADGAIDIPGTAGSVPVRPGELAGQFASSSGGGPILSKGAEIASLVRTVAANYRRQNRHVACGGGQNASTFTSTIYSLEIPLNNKTAGQLHIRRYTPGTGQVLRCTQPGNIWRSRVSSIRGSPAGSGRSN